MALALTTPDSVNEGETILITGTGFTHAGHAKVTVFAEDGEGVTAIGDITADGSGNITTLNKFECQPNGPGYVRISVSDVTAGTEVETRVEVFEIG